MVIKKKVKKGPAPTFGWLRRPELDPKYGNCDVWEAPDGELFGYSKRGKVPIIVEGDCYDDQTPQLPKSV